MLVILTGLLLAMAGPTSARLAAMPPPPEEFIVSTTAHHLSATEQTVQQVFAQAKCGDFIVLSGEFPPYVKVDGLKPSCPVVIDGSRTTLSNLTIANSSNWIVQSSKFGTSKYANINVVNSDHIIVRESSFDGPGSAAVSITSSNHIWVVRNHIERSSGDGVDLAASQFLVISQNVCADNVVTPIHPDCVQAWDVKGKELVSDVWITDNEASGKTQGFDGFDHGDGGFDRVYVVGNKISTTAVWAGQFNACRHCIMAYNKAITLPGQPRGWGGARWFMTDANDDRTADSGRMGNIIKANENGLGL